MSIVSQSLKSLGVERISIDSGPIIHKTLPQFLEKFYQSGKQFQGLDVIKTGNPKNMYILQKDL
ncbi:hypothetical protein [Flavobacterium sp. Root186]|uniref:hypothetical protein n=1 Tax=Flavobacterium sp. Root186 TaxID=1736485 RepID=UPI0006F90210|nr:hypothetical protein [Flavobacterium sp. Root186]KRB56716.1 hypothetical protein ASD98_08475 [Flavobacterium sp. Root186]